MNMEDYLDDDGKKALLEVREAIDPLWDYEGVQDWNPPDQDHRLTYSLSKAKDRFVLRVHFENADSWAARKAEELSSSHSNHILVATAGGAAYASYPSESEEIAPHVQKRAIGPGYSVGHGRYRAGTISALVRIYGATYDETGCLTAAHVVALNHRTVNNQDPIYSPGKPEVGEALTRRHRIGRLRDFVDLYDELSEDMNVFAESDVALVDLQEVDIADRIVPQINMVPDPKKIGNRTKIDLSLDRWLMPLKKVAIENQLAHLIDKPVYKFGRTSGFTSGILRDVGLRAKRLRLPNQRYYLYTGLLAVESSDINKSFSRPGDSGAPLYTKDGTLVGIVLGADTEYTFACAAWRCLEAMQVRLLGTN
jgi:hypothetical protein